MDAGGRIEGGVSGIGAAIPVITGRVAEILPIQPGDDAVVLGIDGVLSVADANTNPGNLDGPIFMRSFSAGQE
jgi:hypothetical protein